MRPRYWLFAFLAALTALRLGYISKLELSPDESYYFLWSQRLDLAYFSKGPAVALAIKLGTTLFGDNEFGVRFLAPLLALGTSLCMFTLARRIYDESIAIWTVVAMNMIPIFNVGSLLMTIDPLSIFFWTAGLLAFWLALERGPGFSFYWPLTGLMIGLGFLSKYTNAMQLLGVVLVLALSSRFRRELIRPGFWSLVLVAVLCTLPPIIWNSRHSWITLAHLSERGGLNSAFSLHPEEVLVFAGLHAGVYSPLIFIGMMMALWWAWPRARHQFNPRFLLCFTLPLLVMYCVLALKKAGEPNWTAPAFISLGILSAALWHEAAQANRTNARYAITALALGLVMSIAILNFDLIRAAGIPLPYRADPSARLRGWRMVGQAVDQFRLEFERTLGNRAFLIANSYGTAASIAFYLSDKRVEGPGHPAVYMPESQDIQNQFSLWPRYDQFVAAPPDQPPKEEYFTEQKGVNPFIGRSALYITTSGDETAPSNLENAFERVEMIALLKFTRHGLPLREIRIFACQNYRSLPL
jgi:hypothetical protein